jgi:hypothetical protein
MIIKKVILFISVVMALAFTNRDSAIRNTSVILTSESSLLVRGTTNVNTFTCGFNINKFKNPIPVVYYLEGDKVTFSKTALVLDNDCFDCGGKGINSDFQKILKSDNHPQIFLLLKEISQLENSSDIQALIDIEIAGITKNYKIPVKIKKNNSLLLTGNLSLNLSDFQIVPPKKFLGLISIKDKIEIFFQLAVKEH